MSSHTKHPRHHRLLRQGTALALGWALAASVGTQQPAGAPVDGRAGVFLFANGPVTVRAGGMANAVVRGTVVHEGDVVETGPGGRAQLRMVDGAMIDLEPGSTLRLAEYQLAAQPKDHRSLMELVRGGLRTLTGVIGQQNQAGYELRVRTVTIGVRGTEYRAELQDEQVSLDVLQGRVALCNPAGCVDLARGESGSAPVKGAAPVRTAAATVPGGAAAQAAAAIAGSGHGVTLPTAPGSVSAGNGGAPFPQVAIGGQPMPVTALPAAPATPATPATPAPPAT
ncbi:MAG: FecR family protein, partial [Pseudomonadota bacterium]|nr:FecR family protein [Pseudomonadota bacterium]